MLSFELAGHDQSQHKDMERCFLASIASGWHMQWSGQEKRFAGWADAPQPLGRATVVLSAAGVSL